MRKSLVLLLLMLACCAHRLSTSDRPETTDALLQRADTYKADGRYLEALTFYRDIAMNPAWAQRTPARLYKNMADIYRDYLGDIAQAQAWYSKYQACAPDAPVEPAFDRSLLAVKQAMPQSIRVLVADSAAPLRITSAGALKITA
jgi:tetratricopeptide (TPR) repeat protein